MPFIVATYVYASSQGQRTHSARTNMVVPQADTVVETAMPLSILKKTKHNYDWTDIVDTYGTPAKVIFLTDTDSDDSAICFKNDTECPPSLDLAPAPGIGENILTCFNHSISGSQADREHRKWEEKAVSMTNNPYSMENIVKRMNKTLSCDESMVSLR